MARNWCPSPLMRRPNAPPSLARDSAGSQWASLPSFNCAYVMANPTAETSVRGQAPSQDRDNWLRMRCHARLTDAIVLRDIASIPVGVSKRPARGPPTQLIGAPTTGVASDVTPPFGGREGQHSCSTPATTAGAGAESPKKAWNSVTSAVPPKVARPSAAEYGPVSTTRDRRTTLMKASIPPTRASCAPQSDRRPAGSLHLFFAHCSYGR